MRSLRIEYGTCNSSARISFPGAMLGRPPAASLSYMREKTESVRVGASFNHSRIGRYG